MDEAVYVTAEGLAEMKAELEERVENRRPEIAEKLSKAIAMGDLKENADYHAAKEESGFNEGRIKELQNALMSVVVIKETAKKDRVTIGATVVICEEGFEDEEETYRIVGAREANPMDGLISNESPIGRALLGAKVGQTVQASTPGGMMEMKVLKIE